jgi:hypothetical protein
MRNRRRKPVQLGAVVDGTTYKDTTNSQVVSLLEAHRKSGKRLCLVYGDLNTGQAWDKRRADCGRVARSMGPQKIPILLTNRRSIGGGGIFDDCILAIYTPGSRHRPLWTAPRYHK